MQAVQGARAQRGWAVAPEEILHQRTHLILQVTHARTARAVPVPVELGMVAASLPNTLEALTHVQFCPYPTQLCPSDTDSPVLTPSSTPSSAHTEG